MGDHKWEELQMDCLVNIFGRVGLESLVEGVPYVCISWFKASLDPLCWQSLIIPRNLPGHPYETKSLGRITAGISFLINQSVHEFIEFLMRRSKRLATVVDFKDACRLSYIPVALNLIGEGCPQLKKLVLPDLSGFGTYKSLSSLIHNWRTLEALEIGGGCSLNEIISQISVHCKSFVSLTATNTKIGDSEATAISTLLPNIKFLCFRESTIERRSLLMILRGCQKLIYFDAGNFMGFGVDDEISNLASHIATFVFEPSWLYGVFYELDELYLDYVDP